MCVASQAFAQSKRRPQDDARISTTRLNESDIPVFLSSYREPAPCKQYLHYTQNAESAQWVSAVRKDFWAKKSPVETGLKAMPMNSLAGRLYVSVVDQETFDLALCIAACAAVGGKRVATEAASALKIALKPMQ
jgi:hypothetical protein